MNAREKIFYEQMTAKGLSLIEQPYLREHRMTPDFYCEEEGVYYEVIGTRQAYHHRKNKIVRAIEAGIPIKVVTPNGEPYPRTRKKKPKPQGKPFKYLSCLRCGHIWKSYLANKPVVCAKCRNSLWDKPKEPKKKKQITIKIVSVKIDLAYIRKLVRQKALKRKIILLEKGITQVALARRFGCSKSMISHLIAGRYKASALQKAIAKALKISFRDFWDCNGTEEK